MNDNEKIIFSINIKPDELDVEGTLVILFFVWTKFMLNNTFNTKIHIDTLYKIFKALESFYEKSYFKDEITCKFNILRSKTLFKMEIERLIEQGFIKTISSRDDRIAIIMENPEEIIEITEVGKLLLLNGKMKSIVDFPTFKFINRFCDEYRNAFRWSQLFSILDFDVNGDYTWEYMKRADERLQQNLNLLIKRETII